MSAYLIISVICPEICKSKCHNNLCVCGGTMVSGVKFLQTSNHVSRWATQYLVFINFLHVYCCA